MTDDSACPECQRLGLALGEAEKGKSAARRLFDSQHTVAGAKDTSSGYRLAADAYQAALAELARHRSSHD